MGVIYTVWPILAERVDWFLRVLYLRVFERLWVFLPLCFFCFCMLIDSVLVVEVVSYVKLLVPISVTATKRIESKCFITLLMFVINKDCTYKGTIFLLVSHRMSDSFRCLQVLCKWIVLYQLLPNAYCVSVEYVSNCWRIRIPLPTDAVSVAGRCVSSVGAIRIYGQLDTHSPARRYGERSDRICIRQRAFTGQHLML